VLNKLGAVAKYSVFLIKQTSIEKISLPSLQYYFDLRNVSTAKMLSSDQSTVIGVNVGTTELLLIDRNMKDEHVVVPPPTALIHVVHAYYLSYSIKNWRSSAWILVAGRVYEIMILPYTVNNQQIFASDNLKIESFFDPKKFRLDIRSNNGSYYQVFVLEKGSTQSHASLESFDEHALTARGEQDIVLLDPIEIVPKSLIFAYLPQSSVQKQQQLDQQQTEVEFLNFKKN
jgi:hypothetical protein